MIIRFKGSEELLFNSSDPLNTKQPWISVCLHCSCHDHRPKGKVAALLTSTGSRPPDQPDAVCCGAPL